MSADQLRAIADIVRAVDADLWLRGGWAMDFFLGRVTRPHRDIDFFCRAPDADHIVTRLADLGFRPQPGNDALQRDLLGTGDLDVQVTLVGQDADGCPVVPAGPYAGARWPADLLVGPPGRIGDLSCRIVNPRAQIEIKEMMPVWVPGLPRRDKDRDDIALLRAALTATPQPGTANPTQQPGPSTGTQQLPPPH